MSRPPPASLVDRPGRTNIGVWDPSGGLGTGGDGPDGGWEFDAFVLFPDE
jgi:hypothetical protein